MRGEGGVGVAGEATVVVATGGGVGEGVEGGLEDLATGDEGLRTEAVLGGLGNPGLEGPPDAIAEEVGLRPEHLVEVEVEEDGAIGGGGGEEGEDGGVGRRGRRVLGGGGEEVEVTEEAVGPFAGAAHGGGGGGLLVGFWERRQRLGESL